MKLIFFLLVLCKNGIKPAEGQLSVLRSPGEVILTTYFDIFYYDVYEKSCCKYQQMKCVNFVNSRGEVAPGYKGRIFTANYVGVFHVKFTKLSIRDAGTYRCGVTGFSSTYDYFQITISDLQNSIELSEISPALAPKSSITPNVLSLTSASTRLGSEKTAEEHSESKNMVLTLAAVCVVVFAVIVLITLLVYRLKRSRDKSGTSGVHDNSPQQSPQEQDETTYTAVNFKSLKDPSELYANLQTQKPSSKCVIKTWESVEYSTILRAPT